VSLKIIRLQLRFGTDDIEILREVSGELGLDASSTFRLLLREKRRQLARETRPRQDRKRRSVEP
jgi:hypothetical protein